MTPAETQGKALDKEQGTILEGTSLPQAAAEWRVPGEGTPPGVLLPGSRKVCSAQSQAAHPCISLICLSQECKDQHLRSPPHRLVCT